VFIVFIPHSLVLNSLTTVETQQPQNQPLQLVEGRMTHARLLGTLDAEQLVEA
jgi:hypothetical protein